MVDIKITKIRTIAEIYPVESLEAEVVIGEMVLYANFDYRECDYKIFSEVDMWIYTKPIDQVNETENGIEEYYAWTNAEIMHYIVDQMKFLFHKLFLNQWDCTNQWHVVNSKPVMKEETTKGERA